LHAITDAEKRLKRRADEKMISPWDAQKSLLLEAAQGTARFELPGSSLANIESSLRRDPLVHHPARLTEL
jgi:hypothetical protein